MKFLECVQNLGSEEPSYRSMLVQIPRLWFDENDFYA